MLLKDNRYDRPLYYTGYIGSTHIERIQVNLGSALSIIPKRLLYFLDISLSMLSTITIYGFNTGSSHPLGKIHLRCQIGDLKSEVTVYVIDADTSCNVLLGQPWIHANWIVTSTLHQYFKYMDDKAMVRTVFAETQPFKGVENYFTDSLLYKESGKTVKKLLPSDIDSGNEAKSESGDNPTISFDEEPIVAYLNDPDCNNSTDNSVEWVLNENINFDYSFLS